MKIPSPQRDLLVVMWRTLVGILTGPLTLSCLSFAPWTKSAQTKASSSKRFFKVIHLVICSTNTRFEIITRSKNKQYKEWVITFLHKIKINKDIININYRIIYNITQLNTINITSPLYHLKSIFQSPITLHMNNTLKSRRNNTHQFHNKQFIGVMQQLY